MSSILNCNDEAGSDVAVQFVYLELAIFSNTLRAQSRTSVEKRPSGQPRSQERAPWKRGTWLKPLVTDFVTVTVHFDT